MVTEIQAVVEELGGARVFHPKPRTESALREAIRKGLPQAAVGPVMRSAGLTLKELAASLDLSARSLQRRRGEGRLSRHESDRLYRLARIVALAKRSLGEDEKAASWLRRPNRALGGSTPLGLVDTELGARAVENVLGRIAYGGIS
jgi:putative toxin-antitoxin system antitoxin component (TIGR02293 family)